MKYVAFLAVLFVQHTVSGQMMNFLYVDGWLITHRDNLEKVRHNTSEIHGLLVDEFDEGKLFFNTFTLTDSIDARDALDKLISEEVSALSLVKMAESEARFTPEKLKHKNLDSGFRYEFISKKRSFKIGYVCLVQGLNGFFMKYEHPIDYSEENLEILMITVNSARKNARN